MYHAPTCTNSDNKGYILTYIVVENLLIYVRPYLCVCVLHDTGKKSPVYGKWKEFYFVIKYGEQKLLYYEREDVSSSQSM